MPVILGENGFCNGVERAIKIALSATKKYGACYCLHPLIHNKSVVKDLEKKNVFLLNQDQLPDKKYPVVISAHGCGNITKNKLINDGYNVIDATCPFVEKIHETILIKAKEGYYIVIIGDKNHAEVIGSKELCDNSIVISDAKDIDFTVSDKFFVTVQSTFSVKRYEEIKNNIKYYNDNLLKTVEFFDSICYTTIDRQINAETLSKKCDCIIVVGDANSSNCTKLLSLAKEHCQNVFLVENVSDLKSIQINNYVMPGIISGASTPKELTMEVFNRMSEEVVINNNVDEVKEEAVTAEAPVAKKEDKGEVTTMEEALKRYQPKNYREGMRLKTRVVKADMTGITVTVEGGGKNDCGFIAREEAELDGSYDMANYKEGDEIEAIVIPKEKSAEKAINLSKRKFDEIKLDDEKVKGILAGEEFTLACNQEIKGGLLGKIGTYTIFVPASQIRIGFVKSLADYVGKPLRLKALPPKEELDEEGNPKRPRNPKRIVASQRVILEAEKASKEEEFWSKIYEGAIVNGKVKRFTSFGAFVSLKQMDALVHNSDLSWSKKRINDPGEVLELNKNYDFVVLSADRESGKISLGYKQLQKKPAEIAQEKYPVGSVVKGKVARLVSFGAFVELEPGIDGLVHISQINHGWIQKAADALKEGDEVEVKVMNYDGDRITLSIKELLPEVPAEAPVEGEDGAAATEKPSRSAAFNKRLEGQEKGEKKEKKPRRAKEEDDGEPREYVSTGSGVTLGDLFKLNIDEENK